LAGKITATVEKPIANTIDLCDTRVAIMPATFTNSAMPDPIKGYALTRLTAPNSLRNRYELTYNHFELSQAGQRHPTAEANRLFRGRAVWRHS
jgi:hypothetical protein